jgi:thiamine-phosphate pyrophosphorylase
MHARHPVPRHWLMTDERMGEVLWTALAQLPRGSGVIFRHYGLSLPERRRLFARIAKIARSRRLVLIRAGADRLGPADGIHGQEHGSGLRTWPAHSRAEIVTGLRAGAHLFFVSPVFPTRSHPDAASLGPVRLGLMVRGVNKPVIALGGMDARRFKRLNGLGIYGWAAIDAWTRDA